MSNINKTVIRNTPVTLEIVDNAAKSGALLSVLIAPTAVKFFAKMAIVEYPALPAEKNVALAKALRNRGVPFAAFDKTLQPTLATIPPAHLAGQQVVEKVYGPAQPATRPVVKPAGAPAPEAAKPVEEPVKLAPTAEGDLAPAPKKEKKARAPRAKKAKGSGEAAAEQAAS